MDDRLQQLKGSESRDWFKQLHKQMLPSVCWCCDVDLELVDKEPIPHIIARIEFKCLGDGPTFTECIAYAEYMVKLAPVYVIYAQHKVAEFCEMAKNGWTSHHRFIVYRLISTDYRPATWKLERVTDSLDWRGLRRWEMDLRHESRLRKTDEHA